MKIQHFSGLYQELQCGGEKSVESIMSCSPRDVQHFFSICSRVPPPTSQGNGNMHTPQTTFLILCSAGGLHLSLLAYTKLAVGRVSLWSGIIFHLCYQMDARWVIVARASALGPPQSPWARACQLADLKMALQRNTPQNCMHLFPALMNWERGRERENENLYRQAFT